MRDIDTMYLKYLIAGAMLIIRKKKAILDSVSLHLVRGQCITINSSIENMLLKSSI